MRALGRKLVGVIVFVSALAPEAAAQTTAASCSGETEEPIASATTQPIPPPRAATFDWANATLAAIALALLCCGLAYIRANERRRRGRRLPERPIERAPYLAGGALGLLFAMSLIGFGRPVGISGGVQNLAGVIGHAVSPANPYWGGVIPIGMTWSAWVVVGVLAGAAFSALVAGRWRVRLTSEDGGAVWRRWLLAFAAGTIVEYAAGIAGGCTSGLAVSGGIALAPGAFVFMVAMFASGVPTAFALHGGRR